MSPAPLGAAPAASPPPSASAAPTAAPSAQATAPVDVPNGPPPVGIPIEATGSALRHRFKACYLALLKVEPSAEGSALLRVVVTTEGTIGSVSVRRSAGLSPSTLECFQRAFAGVRLQPQPEEVIVDVPIRFVQGGRADGGAPDASP